MHSLLVFSFVAVLMAAAMPVVADGSADARRDYLRFQGTWSFARVEVDGALQPPQPFETNKIVIGRDGLYVVLQGDRITRGRFHLDPAARPARFDSMILSGPGKGQIYHGIYDLSGDAYRYCASLRGGGPPEDFSSTPNSGKMLQLLKRESKEYQPQLRRAALMQLAGSWEPATSVDGSRARLVIEASGAFSESQDGHVPVSGTLKIDPDRDPMNLDLRCKGVPPDSRLIRAVSSVDGPSLTICRATAGGPRPHSLSAAPTSGEICTTYRRALAAAK